VVSINKGKHGTLTNENLEVFAARVVNGDVLLCHVKASLIAFVFVDECAINSKANVAIINNWLSC